VWCSRVLKSLGQVIFVTCLSGGAKVEILSSPSCVFLHDGYVTCYFRFLDPQIFVPYSSYSKSNYITLFIRNFTCLLF
jgi:hypothetical protein